MRMSRVVIGLFVIFGFGHDVATTVSLRASHRVLTEDFIGDRTLVIVGDIHGCYDEMVELFHTTGAMVDGILSPDHLVILCGDFTDHGPKSKQVLDFVKANSIVSVRGNHEDIVIDQYIEWKKTGVLKEKYEWVRQLTNEDLSFLLQLPYTVSIPSLNLIVVHAGLIPTIPLDEQDPLVMTTMRNLLLEGSTYTAFDDSKSGGVAWSKLWWGPQHVYFGHDSPRNLQLRPKATGLDTGCVYGRNLTAAVISPMTGTTIVSIAALEAYATYGC